MGWGALLCLLSRRCLVGKCGSCWVIPALTLPQVCLPLHRSTPAGPAPASQLSTLSPPPHTVTLNRPEHLVHALP